MKIADVNLEFLGHSGFLIETKGKRIVIDPYNVSSGIGKADLILITHSHYDHCSIKDIISLSKKATIIVTPADAQSKITKVDGVDMQVIEAGDELDLGYVKVEAVPAYNLGKDFHTKKAGWVGYIVKIGNVIIYHSGDTDNIPEMKNLTGYAKSGNNFVVLLPVSGKYVMDADEATDVAKMLKPTLTIPMHYGAGVAGTIADANKFISLCRAEGIHSEILEKI